VKGLREGLMSVGRGDPGAVVEVPLRRGVKVREGIAFVFLSSGSRTIRWPVLTSRSSPLLPFSRSAAVGLSGSCVARAAGQTPSLSQAVDEVTGSKTRSKPARNQQSPVGARRQLSGPSRPPDQPAQPGGYRKLSSTLNVNVGTVTAAVLVAAASFRRPEQEDSKSNSGRTPGPSRALSQSR
jgi:hypothetical protein